MTLRSLLKLYLPQELNYYDLWLSFLGQKSVNKSLR